MNFTASEFDYWYDVALEVHNDMHPVAEKKSKGKVLRAAGK